MDEHGGIAGLVSLEDLTETLFDTEVIDEMDRVADMRAEALRRRESRRKAQPAVRTFAQRPLT